MSRNTPRKRTPAHHTRTRKNSALKYVGHGEEQDRATLLEKIPDAFISVDTQWQFTYLNHQAETVLGKHRGELLGKNVWQVFPILVGSQLAIKAREAMDKQMSLELTELHPLLNKWFAVRLYPFQDGLYIFSQDITERKKAEEQLQFQANTTWDVRKSIIVTNLQGKIIYWNQGAHLLFGYTADEMIGKTPAILYPELDQKQLEQDLKQIRKGKEYNGLWKGRRKDGSAVWVNIKTSLMNDSNGKPVGYIGIATDSAKSQQENEQFFYYARIAQNKLDAVIATDTNYNILSWNEAAEKLYGWKQEEVLGKYVNDILPTQFFSTTGSEASIVLRNSGYWKGKVIQPRKDGTPLTILSSVSLIKDGSGKIIGAVAANRDMSELEEGTTNDSYNQLL